MKVCGHLRAGPAGGEDVHGRDPADPASRLPGPGRGHVGLRHRLAARLHTRLQQVLHAAAAAATQDSGGFDYRTYLVPLLLFSAVK